MEKCKLLKEAIVLLIVAVMFFSTIAVTANTEEKSTNDQLNPSCFKTTNQNEAISNTPSNLGPALFIQEPYEPDESWAFYTSSTDAGYIVYDNFWEVDEEICDVHWWGLSLVYPWAACDPDGMKFEIIFYKDAAGQPGDPVCGYNDILPNLTPTGKFYSGFEMYLFETDIDPCCIIDIGWISIQSIFSPNQCWFLWAGSDDGDLTAYQNETVLDDDCAFILTAAGPPPVPAICCEGNLLWEEVSPGATVTGTFQLCNCGEPGSYLKWEFVSAPTWPGAIWEIEPDSGEDLLAGDCVTITVNVTAPPDKNTKFEGKIKMVNRENASDFCEVDVVLITPKTKTYNVNPFFQIWLEQHPNLFPIIRQVLGI